MNHTGFGFDGKVCIVTGGSRGIGLEIAKHLLQENAKVVICGRKQEALDVAIKELNGGDGLLAVSAHVAKEGDVNRLFSSTLEKFGTVDILINNVGMNIFTPSVAEADLSLWNKIMEGNLTSAFLCSKKAAAIMKARKSGKILNVSSLAGTKASLGMGIYGIAKAGMDMLTKVMAAELAPSNIQVNGVAPGVVRTDFSKPFWSNDDLQKEIVRHIPSGRIAEKTDVLYSILFLCSSYADYITGQVLMIDGGASAI
ncbi:MAG: 3-alpha-hydroxycholanate dehydrogenase (NADP(+)) [Syntrophus sp. SKADARSKE-3]|nr:3-alpha-hydroxycholanate dehydrogenase (NADP(+)) [Syntrophus sp. SKADARSKE-3]